jgi:hypothetical protein
MNTEERWVNANQVAGHIAVKKDSIYRGIDEKEFPPLKVRRLLKLKLSEVFGHKSMPAQNVRALFKFRNDEVDVGVTSGETAHDNHGNKKPR